MRERSHIIWSLTILGVTTSSVIGCTTTKRVPPRPEPPPPAPVVVEAACDEGLEKRIAELEAELAEGRLEVSNLQARQIELEREIDNKEEKLVSVEERYAVLETELTSAVDQVIRSEGGVRGLQSRALAASRISEVRVQIVAVPHDDDVEVVARLDQARDYLNRADSALDEGTYGAASYLAERAGELVRQARIVGEIRASRAANSHRIIPVIPPRELLLTTNANLRAGPGLDQARVGGMKAGATVVAVARAGPWYKIQTESGDLVWVHGRLLE